MGQVDWWHTGALVPVGRGRTRQVFGLVATLPHSGAHAATFSFTMTVGDVRPGLVGCLVRLGGVPEALVPEYVAGNIFIVLWPSGLCGRRPAASGL